MKVLAKQNRELIMINAQNTQNENDAEKIILQVPEQYEDFNKKIVFVTPDGNVWDIITNNEYLIKKAITKYQQVDFYIWLTKGEVDFRSQTKTLKFYHNVDASDEITDEEIGRVNTVINLLEEEITKVENLETEIDGKLEEIDTAIDDVNTAIQEVENLDLNANKLNKTTTVTLNKKDGTTKTVQIDDGISLQFMWQGTSLGIKTEEQQEYTFVDLQGVQGPVGPQGEPFTIKKTYTSVAEMNADFNNMQLGDYVMIASTVEVEDNAKLYTRGESQWIFITDFSGATGIRGETGLTPNLQIGTVTQGSSFNVTRTGTNENPILNFTLVKGDKGDQGIQGTPGNTGNGIASITKTATVGLVDTYTITYTNGNTTSFTVTNGEDGEVTETELNELRTQVQDLESNQLTALASGQSIDLYDSASAKNRKIKPIGKSIQVGEPTPTSKVDIVNLTGEIKEKVQNKNLWGNNDWSIETYAYFKLPKDDSRYVLSVKLKEGKTIPSGLYLGFSEYGKFINGQAVSWLISNGTFPSGASIKDDTYYRITTNLNYVSIYPTVYKDTITEYFDIQLEENNELSDYISHEEQNVTFPLEEGQVLAEGDYLADDGIHHKKSHRVLDGTEEWTLQNAEVGQFKLVFPEMTKNIILCTHFGCKLSYSASGKPYLRPAEGNLYAEIGTEMLSEVSVNAWKTWLAEQYTNGTPVEIEYQLANEVIESYTQAQQTAWNQIKALRTYKNVTHITGDANIEIIYVRDLQTVINNSGN